MLPHQASPPRFTMLPHNASQCFPTMLPHHASQCFPTMLPHALPQLCSGTAGVMFRVLGVVGVRPYSQRHPFVPLSPSPPQASTKQVVAHQQHSARCTSTPHTMAPTDCVAAGLHRSVRGAPMVSHCAHCAGEAHMQVNMVWITRSCWFQSGEADSPHRATSRMAYGNSPGQTRHLLSLPTGVLSRAHEF